jgi:predicted transcriptional regulator/transcriptional regulator with XRE-family HTH domain
MTERYTIGPKIRALRRQRRITQTDLARQLGVSASYLNLIEHNRRSLGVELLLKLSKILPIDLESLSTEHDEQTTTELLEVFGEPLFENLDLIAQDANELAIAYPTFAEAVVRLYGAFRDARQAAQELAEAISQDATRNEGVHSSRFPNEEVSDLIQERMNYFPELEHGADAIRRDAGLRSGALFDGLATYLQQTFGVKVLIEDASQMQSAVRSYDPDRKVLSLSEGLRRGSRNFQLAYQLGLITQGQAIGRIVAAPVLTSDQSRASCRVALANYFAAALLMPYDDFFEAAKHVRYDIELLGHRFEASFEQTCHRLTTLRRPGAEGIPFHLLRVDIAGNLSKRFSASGLRIPRFSGACPRWNTFGAFFTPGMIRIQLSQMPDGQVFFGVSRTVRKESGGFSAARPQYAIGLGCDLARAGEMVYADGLNLASRDAVVPVGPSCRLCERMDCEERAHPPLHHPFTVDENRRGISYYAPPPPLKYK